MIRLHPLHDLGTLSRQFDRIFEEVGSLDRTVKSAKGDWLPRAELIDRPDNLILRVYLPDVDAKQLDIEATKESIIISGDRPFQQPTEDRRYYWSEFNYGKFRRAFSLPVPIAHDRIQADYHDGILILTLPKVTAGSKKTIKVQLGEVAKPETNKAIENTTTDRVDPIAA
ncbi:MAG: Hsp20/alpha crystallin family protein [Pseudanabaena sp. CRU_2_10]|nr:Hsp20/alpha crystallin family protein [Pseudanabaena sp. CRU_2_10]